jgi:death-on-curing protein
VEPTFLGLDEVLEIHADQIERYGGRAGVRDMGLLESAVSMPRASSVDAYFHTDAYEMAAASLFHIVKNHPFVDGNKRTGTAAAAIFLQMNGLELFCSNEELVELVLAVAESRVDEGKAAAFLRGHSRA